MNIVQIKVKVHREEDPDVTTVPVAVPELSSARALAERLHREGREYSGIAWGWPVYYEPELQEDAAEFQIPDGKGGYKTEIRPFWSPASFTIGESGIWFYSLLWEHGHHEAPIEFLDEQNRST
jgi:hypothetical protein